MAIQPPSDIVLDVAKAADPTRLQAAALKLTGAADGADANEFSNLVNDLDASGFARSRPRPMDDLAALMTGRPMRGGGAGASAGLANPAMKPYRDFEAFVLQSFIQEMLPKDADGIYGQGVAGDMWRSILAQQLGKEIARNGGVGIAKSIFKAHPDAGSKRAHPISMMDSAGQAEGQKAGTGPMARPAIADRTS